MARQVYKVTVKAIDGETLAATAIRYIPIACVLRIRPATDANDSVMLVNEGGINPVKYLVDETISTLSGQVAAGFDVALKVVRRNSDAFTQENNIFPVQGLKGVSMAPGTGGAATAVLGAGGDADKVASITVTAGGKYYTEGTTVVLSGGGGSGATAVPVIENGVITGITVTAAGSSYETVPTVTINPGTKFTNQENGSMPENYISADTLAETEALLIP